jgi:hypothetical protein
MVSSEYITVYSRVSNAELKLLCVRYPLGDFLNVSQFSETYPPGTLIVII